MLASKLALIGAIIAGAHGLTGVTPHQAQQALIDGAWASQTSHIACTPAGRAETCVVTDGTSYTDQAFGPSQIVGQTAFRVARDTHIDGGYRVRVIVPDHFAVYAGG